MIGQQLVEVRVRPFRVSVFCRVSDETIAVGDWVVVDIEDEQECGRVLRGPLAQEDIEGLDETLGKVLRKASAEDQETLRKNQKLEKEALQEARTKIAERQLPMKMVAVDAMFDRTKIKFYFTSDGRIDFRDLVRDLAHVYKTRIEMRQIGVRDQSKMVGGIGVCGQTLCCATWMRKFMPITIKMAKEQNLSLNPQKISGQCGRLLCCLSYEVDTYKQEKKNFPKMGKEIETPEGKGIVQQINIIKGTVMVKIDDAFHEFKLCEIGRMQKEAEAVKTEEPPVEEMREDDFPGLDEEEPL